MIKKLRPVTEGYLCKRRPGIVWRWQCFDELLAIRDGAWAFTGFDDYGEENHDPIYDDMYFKSFSTHETPQQIIDFFDDTITVFDENGLENLGKGTKFVDYVYDPETNENEKRLVSPRRMLPIVDECGEYWQLVKAIYVPESNLKAFIDKFLPKIEDDAVIPPYGVVKGL